MTRKFGGVRITMQRVASKVCACGKPFDLCNADWDAKLKIVSHASDTRHSAYKDNIDKIRKAQAEGLDPYCFRANFPYTSNWTPHMPPGSFSPIARPYRKSARETPTKTSGGTLGTKTGSGAKSRSGRRGNSGGSGRRGRR